MANPFFRITQDVQEEHATCVGDMDHLKVLKKSQDPRVIHRYHQLLSHKSKCPICTAPRIYAASRWANRKLRGILLRKVF